MVESIRDRSEGCSMIISEREKVIWHPVKNTFELVIDLFDYKGATIFSWDNFQRYGTRVLGWLDKFYTPINLGGSSPVKEYSIKGSARGSNHFPVLFSLEFAHEEFNVYKMNTIPYFTRA